MTILAARQLLGNISVRELNRLLAAHGLPTGSPHKPVRMAAGMMTAAGERAVREIAEARQQSPIVVADVLLQAPPQAVPGPSVELARLLAQMDWQRAEIARLSDVAQRQHALLGEIVRAVTALQEPARAVERRVSWVDRAREWLEFAPPMVAYAETMRGGRRH